MSGEYITMKVLKKQQKGEVIMKRSIVLTLVLSLLVSVFCQAAVAAQDTPQGSQGSGEFRIETTFKSQTLVPNQMLTAKVKVSNISASSYAGNKDVMAVVALYNSNNTMINVSYISKGIPYQGTDTLSAGFKLPSDLTGHKVKAFVWDGVDLKSSNMIPLSNEAVLESEDLKVDLPVVGSYENLLQLLPSSIPPPIDYDTVVGGPGPTPTPAALPSPVPTLAPGTTYSKTNNQVTGVDEADIVQTDGQYIYQVNQNRIIITKAYPAEDMKVSSIVESAGSNFYPKEIYIGGQRLVVIGSGITYKPYNDALYATPTPLPAQPYSTGYYSQVQLSTCKAIIYDTSDKSNIKKLREIELEGNYVSSRKIGSLVYLVSNKNFSYYLDKNTILPSYRDTYEGSGFTPINYTEIHYIPEFVKPSIMTIAGFNISDESDKVKVSSFLGDAQKMYVSEQSMYIAATDYYTYGPVINVVPMPIPTGVTPTPGIISSPIPTAAPIRNYHYDTTLVYKLALNNGAVKYQGKGEVPGRILNQFSMDEYNDTFRIATTSGGNMYNNLYVLDKDMSVIGRLEKMAPGEKIYSTRFMGEKAFIVTFRLVDPLFVINLKDPAKPAVLGDLKIPGYSDYLQPYDENHLIGFGKDTVNGLMQGVKLALFDVTDVKNPVQEFSETIGTRGTSSELNYNHRALLFDKDKNLLAFPILVYENIPSSSLYGQASFQGFYIYGIDLNKGFVLKGRITHISSQNGAAQFYYYSTNSEFIKRGLYINDVLYTISDAKIKANDLSDLKEINTLPLQSNPYPTPTPLPVP